jgi:hypothetical protein
VGINTTLFDLINTYWGGEMYRIDNDLRQWPSELAGRVRK